jgi:spermidine synthase
VEAEVERVPVEHALPWPIAGALVFLTSGCVLVLEILAGRLLAPYVGVTLQTYTGVIGTVLAGIALGTWCGGAAADRVEPRLLIGPLVVAGGATALATVPLVRAFGSQMQGGGAGAIVVLSAVGFIAPAALLSAVTPAVVKMRLRSLHDTGSVVGTLSALSTAGAIVGTFVAGFVLVATVPVTSLIVTIGTGLVLLGLALWWRLRGIGAATIAVLIVVGGGGTALAFAVGRPCDVETTYYCAMVRVDPDRASGRVLVLDDLRHSYVDLDDPSYIEFRYLRVAVDVIDATWPAAEPIDALHVGGGGFTLPRWLEATHPGTRSLVLELDPGIVDLARDRLGLETGPDLVVDTGDARLGIQDVPDDGYDLVMGDAFGGRSVPWHLTTREFVREVDRTLRDDGLYVVNVIDGPQLRFAKAETATLADVFAHVAVVVTPAALEGRSSSNVVLIASQRAIDVDAVAARVGANGDGDLVLTGADLDALVGDAVVLRDDFAPVDQYLNSDS